MEALELSERTVPGKGGKAGPQGQYGLNKAMSCKGGDYVFLSNIYKAQSLTMISTYRF